MRSDAAVAQRSMAPGKLILTLPLAGEGDFLVDLNNNRAKEGINAYNNGNMKHAAKIAQLGTKLKFAATSPLLLRWTHVLLSWMMLLTGM